MKLLAEETSGTTLTYRDMDSRVGPLTLVASEHGLCSLVFGDWESSRHKLISWANRWYGESTWKEDKVGLLQAEQQLEQYFAGERVRFELPLDLRGTPFQLQVWNALLTVSFGQTASYKDIAVAIDAPKAVRAVGGANNRNPISIVVPCHRVIGANGKLVGYGGGLDIKTILLDLEKNSSRTN